MNKIKIISNPYKEEIVFKEYNNQKNDWQDIRINNPDSDLLDTEIATSFLPFKIQTIISIIKTEYTSANDNVLIEFEGTSEEYSEVKNVCNEDQFKDKIELVKSNNYLENAKYIFEDTKDVFDTIEPIIKKIIKDPESGIRKNLTKVSEALKDVIPICVFGNYSAGKSTFINALIGYEYLPSGGDPITAKIYQISRSPHPQSAVIKFKYKKDNAFEEIKLTFDENEYKVRKGDEQTDILVEIADEVNKCSEDDLIGKISKALVIINGYEKRDKENTVIGSVIELCVPFSKEGILGQSMNNFVIFDTPGSNSASNIDHSEVLSEALEGFSNGIPVWVTTYETIDSDDNASLCKKIKGIKALDKRFNMIVVNRADNSDLPSEGFSKQKIKDILEYNSVEEMYSSGIYFVSSIIGLGAKNNGVLRDKFYKKTYRSVSIFSDPDDEDYSQLYIYNIMPEQIKNQAVNYSQNCTDLIYANSGLFCIEMEMESFATKYAAYNKCQMVKVFLEEVVGETKDRIQRETNALRRTKDAREKQLDDTKTKLLVSLEKKSEEIDESYEKQSREHVKNYLDTQIDYSVESTRFNEIDSAQRDKNLQDVRYSEQEEIISDSKTKMWSHFKANGKSLFKGEFLESLKMLKEDIVRDYKEIVELQDKIDKSEKEADRITSDETIQAVIELYKSNIIDANDKIAVELKKYWMDMSKETRGALIELVTESEALSESQRELVSKVILDYHDMELNDNAENIFIKKKFLRGNVLGIKVNDSEKLNIKRLTVIYNNRINDSVRKMARDLNSSYYKSSNLWLKLLKSIIADNIVKLNPELRGIEYMITEETERITELEDDQNTIERSLDAIDEMIAWK